MRSLARWTSRRQASDGIPPSAIPAPRRAPTWPRQTFVDEDPFWTPDAAELPSRLPAEDPNLLTAYPAVRENAFLTALALTAAARAAGRQAGCQILAVSATHEYEAAVGQNLAMLADQDHPVVTR